MFIQFRISSFYYINTIIMCPCRIYPNWIFSKVTFITGGLPYIGTPDNHETWLDTYESINGIKCGQWRPLTSAKCI